MIVTGECIVMEQGEYRDIKFADDAAMFPLDRIERLLPLAKRVIYDSTEDAAVNTILKSSAIKRLCYPAMRAQIGGVSIDGCTDYRNHNVHKYLKDWRAVLGYNYNEPMAKLLATLVNRYIVTYKIALFNAIVSQETLCSIDQIESASITPSVSRVQYTKIKMPAADRSILAVDMAKLYDELYLDGWVITHFGNQMLI